MTDRTCVKCGHIFRDPSTLRRHQAKKKSCVDVAEVEDLTEDELQKKYACRFCGRRFATKPSVTRHMQRTCKIATSDEGMEKLLEHTLRRQLAEQTAQIAKLATLLEGKASGAIVSSAPPVPSQLATTIVNGPVTQTTQQTLQQINISKIEIQPWNDKRALTLDVQDVLAAFAENARLREYARMTDIQRTDPEIAPPFVAELFMDAVHRIHKDPATRNIYLNPKRADQVLVHLKNGRWEVRTFVSASQALLDGIASSIHEITLTNEKRRQLPLEAQNALAVAGLLYDEEPEAYVELTKGPMVAHLTNLALERATLPSSEIAEKK
jgi:hypothetical protein